MSTRGPSHPSKDVVRRATFMRGGRDERGGYAFQIRRALIAKQLAPAFSASASRLVQRLQHYATTRSRSIDFVIEPM